MTLQRPAVALRPADGGGGLAALNPLASQTLTLPQAAGIDLTVLLSVGRDHDRMEVRLAPGSRLAGTGLEDDLAVGIGYGDEIEDVLTGGLTGVAVGPDAVGLTVVVATRKLAARRLDRTYTDMSVGDVVIDLLETSDVAVGTVDAATSYAVYHVDARRSVWEHLHALAARTGSQITTGPDGAVSFAPAPGMTAGGLGGALGAAAGAAAAAVSALGLGDAPSLRTGANVLAWSVGPRTAPPPQAVSPLGAASLAGPDKWGVPRGEPQSRSDTTLVDPALRDQASADTATAARAAAASRASRGGSLTVVGDPALRPGQVVSFEEDDWRVLSVRHRVSGSGFLTHLTVEGAA